MNNEPLMKFESVFIKLGGDGTSFYEGFGVKLYGESHEINFRGVFI